MRLIRVNPYETRLERDLSVEVSPMRARTTCAAVFLVATAAVAVLAQGSAPRFVGAWSNVASDKTEEGHARGVEIELWQKDGKYAGYLTEYVGPTADPPVGKLEAIELDEKSGAIAFTAKLSTGLAPAPGGNAWVPTKNLYEFKGTIGADRMAGTLRRKSMQEDGTALAYDESLTLNARHRERGETFEEWTRRWTDALTKRGPKW